MMAAELACLFPKGLKHEEAKHRTQWHQPPFRFVPDKIKESEEWGLAFVQGNLG